VGSELEEAWSALLEVVPAGWSVGRPSEHPERNEWALYAYDANERPKVGVRSYEWIAKASTEVGVVIEMRPCLQAIVEGRTPK
jgi:hypothetical protein